MATPMMVELLDNRELQGKGMTHSCRMSQQALSNLLAVKTDMCGCRFELSVKDVRFIGYPILIDPLKKTSLQMFHLAFVLDARLEPEIVNGFYSLCKRLAVGLKYMDTNKRYLTSQVQAMIVTHEEVANRGKSDNGALDPYDEIAKQSDLAQHLVSIYNTLSTSGDCRVNLDDWFNVSFVMPYKAYANLPQGNYFN
ncbi:GATOR complex protein NPRL3-like, partial [Hyalella azteca]|uniref:GATOR complex protein NPRL3 n=1 Tax=Hyalella azteca TaxID=294128 RepID=A0A8B7PG80_HYAAZ